MMSTGWTSRVTLGAALASLLALSGTACNTGDLEPGGSSASDDGDRTEQKGQAVGESTEAYTFDGVGSENIPSYSERVTQHLVNRMRMDPEAFGLKNPDTGEFLPAELPAILDPGMIEVGRWQGQHAISYNCYCPTDPMKDGAFNSCCRLTRRDGEVKCASGRVACAAPQATEEGDRWDLLETGTASVQQETYTNDSVARSQAPPAIPGESLATSFAQNSPTIFKGSSAFSIAQVAKPVPPEECLPKEEPCDRGTCVDPSSGKTTCDGGDCSGQCWGGVCDGFCEPEEENETGPVSCTLPEKPDSSQCDPSNYEDMGFYVSVLTGNTREPLPTLMDGIHLKLGTGDTAIFGETPADSIDFQVHYYDPGGDAQQSDVVVGGQCHNLEVEKRNGTNNASPSADASSDAGMSAYFGDRYGTQIPLEEGCHRYVFSFTDSDGFIHTYPSHGSLGARLVEQEGALLPAANDESCPLWSPDRPDTSCLPEGDQCVSGETRSCYTGRPSTRGKGICANGTEWCQNGRWSGVCDNETTPEPSETCGDDVDNNCNGIVDEGCEEDRLPIGGQDTGTAGDDTGTPTDDAGPSDDDATSNPGGPDGGDQMPDATSTDDAGTPGGSGDTSISVGGGGDGGDSGCGCATNNRGLPPFSPSALLVLIGTAFLRRRTRS
jgi:hypothetical protein